MANKLIYSKGYLPTSSIPTLSIPNIDQMGIDKVGIDKAGIDEVGINPARKGLVLNWEQGFFV